MRPYTSGLATYILLCLMLTPELWGPWLLGVGPFRGLIALGVLAKCMPAAFALFALATRVGAMRHIPQCALLQWWIPK